MKTNQLLRLLWIDAFAREHGQINRSNICDAWGISMPQSTKDLTYLSTKYPSRYKYDVCAKAYVWTETKRFINPQPALGIIKTLSEYTNA